MSNSVAYVVDANSIFFRISGAAGPASFIL
jgi:hypothetical protein